jgi:hypothetical protein
MKNSLKKDYDKLTLEEKTILSEFIENQQESKTSLKKLAEDLPEVAKHGAKTFGQNLEKSKLDPEEKKKANDIFSQIFLKRLEEAGAKIFQDLEKGEGVLYNLILSERVIDLLDIIQEFKAKIDQYLPIPSDQILAMAAPAIIGVVATFAPGLAVVMKTTGMIERAASFLDDDNLTKTMNKMKTDLAKVEKDKKLGFVGATVELAKLGVDKKTLDVVVNEVEKTPELKSFMKDLGAYSDKVFPKTEKDIDRMVAQVKKSAIDSLIKANAPKELVEKVSKQMDKSLLEMKNALKPTIDPKVKIFDKIKAQTNASKLAVSSVNDISKIIKEAMPDKKATADKIISNVNVAVKEQVNTRMQGGLDKMAQQLKNPKVKGFAQKTLGCGHSTLIDIERSTMPQKGKVGGRGI